MTLAYRIDFHALTEPVARRLLGEPNPRLSRPPRELRFGTHGSVSVDLTRDTYFDHENNTGGGVIDLIKRKGPDATTQARCRRCVSSCSQSSALV
jgi:hypothetical protein